MTYSPESAHLHNPQILWILLLPLLGVVVSLAVNHGRTRDALLVLVGALTALVVLSFYPVVASGKIPHVFLIEPIPHLPIAFSLEPLGLLFAIVASVLWTVTTLYSSGYMHGNKEKNQSSFYLCFSLAISATMGIALADNLFTLFIFYELLTLSTYPLVTHAGTKEAERSGKLYLGILMFSSIAFFLTAILWTYAIAGTTDFTQGGVIGGHIGPVTSGFLLLLFVFGIGKAALMPLHGWLPAAMVAPTPVSALLHAVAVVKAGVFCIVKILVYIFGIDVANELRDQSWLASGWLVYASGLTILIASWVALNQDNLKRRLAYSTISQLSYVIMAVSLLTPHAVMAAGFHVAAHAVGKITLFFAAGSIYTASKKTLVSQLDGIGRRMPCTMAAFAIGALSMIGIPPAVGFITKYYLAIGAVDTRHWFALCVVILSTLLNAAYFLPIIVRAFFAEEPLAFPKKIKADHSEAPLTMVVAMALTAGLTLALFIFPDPVLRLAQLAYLF